MGRSVSFDVLALNKASEALATVAAEVTRLDQKIDGAGGTIEIDADTAKAREQIAAVDSQLARLNAKSLKIDADILDARRQLQILEAEAKTATGDRKVKVDADIAQAQAKLRALEGAKVSIDVDTGAAQAKLAAIEAAMKKVSGDKVKVPVDVDAAAGLGKLAELGAQLRNIKTPVLIPIAIGGALEALSWIQAVAGGLAALGAAGAAGFGVTKVALTGVGDAVSELGTKVESTGGAVSSNASTMRSAIRGVEAAQRDLRDANEAVERSEDDLQQAQIDAYDAVKALDQARKDATRTLEDYALQTASMGLRQEAADLAVARSQERLAEVNRDSKSTALDRAEAELAVREALQRQNELSVDAKRLAEDKTEADKKGVEQSDQVVAASDRVADSNKRVEEAQRGIERAHENVELAAQRLADAQLAVQEASKSAGSAGSKAADDQREAFEQLTPEGQRFATFLRDMLDGPLADLQDTAQAGVLPGLQAGISGFMSELGDANSRVASISESVSGFFEDVGPAAGRAADAVLRLADVGAEATFDDLAGWVSDTLDRFTEWANSQSAADIAADVQDVADKLQELWSTGTQTLDALQLAWAAMTFPVDIINAPVDALLSLYDAVRQVTDHIPGMKGMLPDLSGEFDRLRSSVDGNDTANRNLDTSSRNLSATQRDLEASTRAAKDEFLRGEESSIRYEASLNRAEEAAKRNGEAWSKGTEKGRDNRQAILELIKASDDYLTSLANQGASTDEIKTKYDQQRAKLIEVATQMTGNKAKAQEYIDKLLEIPATKTTKITADTASALANIKAISQSISQLSDKTVNIRTVYSSGTVTNVRAQATGGWVPGAPSEVDTEPYMLAKGEYVVRSAAAAEWGPLLEQINAGATPDQVRAPIATRFATAAPSPVPAQGGVTEVHFHFDNVIGTNDEAIRVMSTALQEGIRRGVIPASLLATS